MCDSCYAVTPSERYQNFLLYPNSVSVLNSVNQDYKLESHGKGNKLVCRQFH
jgi:hypothetical protein